MMGCVSGSKIGPSSVSQARPAGRIFLTAALGDQEPPLSRFRACGRLQPIQDAKMIAPIISQLQYRLALKYDELNILLYMLLIKVKQMNAKWIPLLHSGQIQT